MALRKLEPGEESRGIHNIEAVDKDGNVLARYECDCPWCDTWRAAEPILAEGIRALDENVFARMQHDGIIDIQE